MPRRKTRDVKRSLYSVYVRRATECLDVAKASFEQGRWTACAINAVHAGIAAADALCVYYLGKRNASDAHEDAVRLLDTIDLEPRERRAATQRVSRLLGIKTPAEYEERLVSRTEAEKALKEADRLVAFAIGKLPKMGQ